MFKFKVAIYSGSIPSTIFIENLIEALSSQNINIYIFGHKTGNYLKPSENIILFVRPNHRLGRIYYFLKQVLILCLSKPKNFYKLIKYYIYNSNEINMHFILWLNKVIPIVNNLPDIFHIQWAKSLKHWIFLNEIFKTKIILSLRGAHINYSPIYDEKLANEYKKMFSKVDFFHAVSYAILNEASKYFDIKSKSQIIYTGFNNLILKKKKKYKTTTTFKFISVGRYHWKKGYQYSISAINILLKAGYDVNYTIITEGQPTEEILYQIQDMRIFNNIQLISLAKQEDIYRKIINSNCLILSSVEEGIANVVIEAMGLGTPVISSDCGGMSEVISDNENGLLYKSRDVNSLVSSMKNMIEMEDKDRIMMIENAKNKIKSEFSMDRLGSKMYKLYLNVLNET